MIGNVYADNLVMFGEVVFEMTRTDMRTRSTQYPAPVQCRGLTARPTVAANRLDYTIHKYINWPTIESNAIQY